MVWKLLLAVQNLVVLSHSVDLSGKIYQTNAALEKENLMFCYECNTIVNGLSCNNFTDKEEYSKFSTKCTGDRKTCMVKRYSYTMINDSSSSGQQLWSLERNCSGKCEDGCIIIGERIKIYACQACCETPLCNVSNGSAGSASPSVLCSLAVCLATLFLLLRTASDGSWSTACRAAERRGSPVPTPGVDATVVRTLWPTGPAVESGNGPDASCRSRRGRSDPAR